jgi:hypothetical protein
MSSTKASTPASPVSGGGKFSLLARFTEQKLDLFRDQVFRLKGSHFPYEHGKSALDALIVIADEQLRQIASALATKNDDLVQAACSTANSAVARLLPLLGFILRSTNVRNSFEYYDGLLRLSKQLTDKNVKLILSSEWEFSPLTYPIGLKDLPDFVLIGLPASEAGNALIIPLAGHEIGHSIWQHHELELRLNSEITYTIEQMYTDNFSTLVANHAFLAGTDPLQNLFSATYIGESLEYLMSQCEEVFCDICGILLFGEGFLYSFLYLLGPNVGGLRVEEYPSLPTRANYLTKIAKDLGYTVPEHFDGAFFETDISRDARLTFLTTEALVSNAMDSSLLRDSPSAAMSGGQSC